MKITISHPHGNPNSYHAAKALSEVRWLRSFEQGIASRGVVSMLADKLPVDADKRLRNRKFEDIPEAKQRPHILWETISRLGQKLKPAGLTPKVNWYDVLFCGHDLQVSRELEHDLDAIYAYEDGAKWTFTAAKRRNARAVYELPLGYYAGVASELSRAKKERPSLPFDIKVEPQWKQQRKNVELELADLIVVPCGWAAESLRFSQTLGKKPTIKIPYGTPADEIPARTHRPDGPFTILFAGQIGLRKGVPHLLEAWQKLNLKDARLWLAGGMHLGSDYLIETSESFEHLGALPRVRLLEVMQQADLFVFPSLAEGFGLVIGEAMAAGVPVLTTMNTGGPELITNGREGWCVAAHDVDALTERIEWAFRHRDELFEMGKLARRRAAQWTWANYRRKLIDELSRHLG
ncbi:MAG: glycosyltransferase family 4 protein [Pyrinomonadaceae bacterium]|nr:glycosyltransferase family 4 protein [Pyrinomonadaceae bacterium]